MTLVRRDGPVCSVVIVNYRSTDLLRQALRSLCEARRFPECEVIVVNNASGDKGQELVAAEFKDVRWIGLKYNTGFGKACNVGAQQAAGASTFFF